VPGHRIEDQAARSIEDSRHDTLAVSGRLYFQSTDDDERRRADGGPLGPEADFTVVQKREGVEVVEATSPDAPPEMDAGPFNNRLWGHDLRHGARQMAHGQSRCRSHGSCVHQPAAAITAGARFAAPAAAFAKCASLNP
jgi:hypothetical protein